MKQSAAVFLLGLIVVLSSSLSYVFYNSINNLLMVEIEKRAEAIAESVAENAQFGVLLSDRLTLFQLTSSYMEEDDVRYIWVVDKEGTPILPGAWSINKQVFDQALIKSVLETGVAAAMQTNLGAAIRDDAEFNGYHVAVPVWHEMYDHILDADVDENVGADTVVADNLELIGMVQVGLSLEGVREKAQLAVLRSGFLVIGVTFLALVVAATLLHRWLEPLQVVTSMAKHIQEKGYDDAVENSTAFAPGAYDRSAVHGRVDEIGQLYQTFNDMIQEVTRHGQRLKEQKQYLKQMVGDQTAELVLAKEAAESANRSKSVFLASMSHEIRTPLNAVLAYTDMLQAGHGLPEGKKTEYLGHIQTSGQQLLSIIDDILDLTQLEANNFAVQKQTFNISACVNSALAIEQYHADEKGIKIVTNVINDDVQSDDRIIRQMIVNLLSNAIKFTPEGGQIDVNASVDDAKLIFEVCDTGIGMDDEEIEKFQEAFVQGKAIDRSIKIEGAGLGLALVRRFNALLKGKIHIYSEKGEGTVVRLTIPI